MLKRMLKRMLMKFIKNTNKMFLYKTINVLFDLFQCY
jgi:hypothetical protein